MVKPEISQQLFAMFTDKTQLKAAVVNEEWHCFNHMAGMALLLCPGTVSRVAWSASDSPRQFPPSLSSPLGPGRPQGLSFCCPSSSSHEILLAPFRPFSSGMEVGGKEKCLKLSICFQGFFLHVYVYVCVCV